MWKYPSFFRPQQSALFSEVIAAYYELTYAD